jgi:hypothetical protein
MPSCRTGHSNGSPRGLGCVYNTITREAELSGEQVRKALRGEPLWQPAFFVFKARGTPSPNGGMLDRHGPIAHQHRPERSYE